MSTTFTPELISLGTVPNDGTGDVPREVGRKVNANMEALQQFLASLPAGTTAASIATSLAAGLVKPGSTLTIAPDGTIDTIGQAFDAIPKRAVADGTEAPLFRNATTGEYDEIGLPAIQTWMANNDGTIDETKLTPLTKDQVSSGSFRMIFAGGPGTATFATILAAIGALPTKAVSGSQRDLQLWYLAPCDGTSHPMSPSDALAAYPNCGATGTIEHDTAAWLQAEYDFRTGKGGTICLSSGATMMVSQTLYIQNADKVYFHGTGQAVTLIGTQCVAAGQPVLHLANAHAVGTVLFGFSIQAQNGIVGLSNADDGSGKPFGPGTPAKGFTPGATAIFIELCQGIDVERVAWNGFDESIKWGDNTYGIGFLNGGGSGNNIGFSWSETGGLNSMERIRFIGGALAGNNYGFLFNAVYAGQYPQGGSIFIGDSAIDYNYVQQGRYIGTPTGNTYCLSSMHINNCHIETTSQISGTAQCRIFSQGVLFITNNEIYELVPSVPLGIVEVADNTACFITHNRVNAAGMAMAWSGTAGPKKVEAAFNTMQYLFGQVVALQDLNGTRLQPDSLRDNSTAILFGDPSAADWPNYYGQDLMLDYFNGDGTFTFPARSTFAFPVGYGGRIVNAGAHTITFGTASGKCTSLQPPTFTGGPAPLKLLPGGIAFFRMHDASSNEWIVAGGLTS